MVSLNNNAKWGRNPDSRKALVTELYNQYGGIVTRPQILAFLVSTNRTVNDVSWLLNGTIYRAGRGQYTLSPLLASTVTEVAEAQASL